DQFGQKSAAEGNYKITINAKTGVGEVKKTDIFKIKHGATDEAMVLHKVNAEAADVTAITGRDLVPKGEYTVSLGDAVVAGAFEQTAFKGGAAATDNDPLTGGTVPTLVHSDLGGASISVEVVKKETIGADEFLTYNVKANVLALDGSTFAVEKSYILNGTTLDSANLGTMSSYLEGVTLEAAAAHDVGYKSIYNLASDTTTAPNANKSIKVTAPNSSDATGPGTAADNVFHIEAGKVAGKTVDFMTYHLDEVTGDIRTVTTSITFDTGFDDASANGTLTNPDSTGTGTAGAYTAKGNSAAGIIGSTAAESTKLYDIDKFWNSEGRFLLEDPQTLTITQGNGKQATVTLYQNDTIKSLISKLNKAIGTDLGQSAYLDGVDSTSFARFGNASVYSGALSVDGTIVISSAVTGSAGELSFAGDEDLIKALSLNVLKASTESDYEVTIADAHSGQVFVQNEQVTGNKLIGLVHENIDVVFDSMLGITVSNIDDAGYFEYSYAEDNVITLHLADNTTVFQIGANEGEDMGINVGDMRAEALGLDKVLVTDRESAARSITIIDNAIDKVSTQRAKIGAYQNRLEHSITNLTIASENLTAAESRIRDTDMAKEMMNFTKLQIMLQAGTSMLAQANTLPQNILSLVR
ncbi:MAG: flagellin, partial [Synergistaceae bacterium]|nr:flagellin [Synergistaceae bacterium]